MFEFTGCFYWLSTFVAHTKAFSTLKAQETLIRNNCTLCGKLFKTTNLQNHKRNHTKSQFSNKRSDPLHLIFWQLFWLEWFLMGQRTACLVTLMYFLEKWPLWKHSSDHRSAVVLRQHLPRTPGQTPPWDGAEVQFWKSRRWEHVRLSARQVLHMLANPDHQQESSRKHPAFWWRNFYRVSHDTGHLKIWLSLRPFMKSGT